MPTILIDVDYDLDISWTSIDWTCFPLGTKIRLGLRIVYPVNYQYRGALKFLLNTLPAGATVTQVRLKVYCRVAGAATHLLDIHAYDTNGQTDVETEAVPPDCDLGYAHCVSGNLYVNDSDALRTVGTKWFTLGGSVCTDVQNAKSAVNRFSLGLHEEGDDANPHAEIDTLETVGGIPAQLEITYTVPLRNVGLHPSKVLPLILDE